jgi:hypothetical protein
LASIPGKKTEIFVFCTELMPFLGHTLLHIQWVSVPFIPRNKQQDGWVKHPLVTSVAFKIPLFLEWCLITQGDNFLLLDANT